MVVAREVEVGAVKEGGRLWEVMGGNAVVAFRLVDVDTDGSDDMVDNSEISDHLCPVRRVKAKAGKAKARKF